MSCQYVAMATQRTLRSTPAPSESVVPSGLSLGGDKFNISAALLDRTWPELSLYKMMVRREDFGEVANTSGL